MFKTSDKPKNKINTDFEINTVIAEGIVIEGDLLGKDSIRIDGTLRGDIRIDKGVVIGESGHVEGNVTCESIIVFGNVLGDIRCQTLYLKSSGTLTGNVSVELFSIDLGGRLNGLIGMNTDRAPIPLEQKAVS